MRWLYVIQQRISITSTECTAILTIGFLLVLGIVVQEVRRQPARFGDEHYAASDQVFMRARPAIAESTLAAGDTSVAGRASSSASSQPSGASASGGLRDGGDAAPGGSGSTQQRTRAPSIAGPVDLNTATAAQLQSLPRIGPKIAERILAYRASNGPFRSPHQLLQVSGIGQKTLENLLPLITVAPPEADTTR